MKMKVYTREEFTDQNVKLKNVCGYNMCYVITGQVMAMHAEF